MKLMKMGEYDTSIKVYTPKTAYERAQEENNAFEEEEEYYLTHKDKRVTLEVRKRILEDK